MLGGVQFNPLFDSRDTYSKETQGMMEFEEREKKNICNLDPSKNCIPEKISLAWSSKDLYYISHLLNGTLIFCEKSGLSGY